MLSLFSQGTGPWHKDKLLGEWTPWQKHRVRCVKTVYGNE